MKRSDFYDGYRKHRKVDFLEHIGIVHYWACRKFDLTRKELFFLFKLHSLGTFLRGDLENGKYFFDNRKWYKLLNEDWVIIKALRNGKKNNYNVYEVSRKCTEMINRCYRMLLEEEEIPTDPRSNPMYKDKRYTDRRHFDAIEMFNNAVKNKKLDASNKENTK